MEVRISWASPLFAPGVAGFDSLKLYCLAAVVTQAPNPARQRRLRMPAAPPGPCISHALSGELGVDFCEESWHA